MHDIFIIGIVKLKDDNKRYLLHVLFYFEFLLLV